jgi:antitoxin component of RelBE/YafQ-DinJ toxin-antitoxin module
MNKTTLQIPINETLRNRASKNATLQGFSSLQEVLRVFINKFAKNEIQFNFTEPIVYLSEKNNKRYSRMIDEIESGKVKAKSFSNADLLIKELEK